MTPTTKLCGWLLCFFASHATALSSSNEPVAGITTTVSVSDESPLLPNVRTTVQLRLEVVGHIYGDIDLQQPNIDGAVVLYDPKVKFLKELERQTDQPKQIITKDFELFPRRAGDIEIAPIEMGIVYFDQRDDEYKQANIQTAPLTLTISPLPGLAADVNALVSSEVQLGSSSIPTQATAFEVGDSVELSYSIYAKQSHSMLLPQFDFPHIEGTSRYLKPAVTKDARSYQGDPVAIRSQKVVYIFETGGEFEFPQQQIEWWDSVNNQLQLSSVAAISWTVAAAPVPLWSWDNGFKLIALLGVVAITAYLWRQRRIGIKLFHRLNRTERKALERQFWLAYQRSDWQALWYQLERLLQQSDSSKLSLRQQLGKTSAATTLLQLAFNNGNGTLTSTEAQALLTQVSSKPRQAKAEFSLNLNH
ncbi:BatD family protein [Ferrimonas lipolytica]|uniref:Protein BatD n=1 Tax=Ferrimonas lipolytica TaxID=2724191 RepID=A0A6H1UFF9_9GAMM|nr:BatD family protein [Ferrimonas lipolytica]QIZ76532.1 protein BatD [Ferrimonas lipolytica]